MRLFYSKRALLPEELDRLVTIDYDREMAFIATAVSAQGEAETLGVVRAEARGGGADYEMAIVVRSDLKRLGLGRMLLNKMIRYCRARGARRLTAYTLGVNRAMLGLAQSLGFTATASQDGVVELVLPLETPNAVT